MKEIFAAMMVVVTLFMSGCKSLLLLSDNIGEKELFIVAKLNPTTIGEVIKACSGLHIINVDEYYTGITHQPDYEVPFFDPTMQNERFPIIRLKVTFRPNNNDALKQTRNALLRLQEVLNIYVK